MTPRQLLMQASLDLFLQALTPDDVAAQLEDLAQELVDDRWTLPGEGKLTAVRAQELLLDWLDGAGN